MSREAHGAAEASWFGAALRRRVAAIRSTLDVLALSAVTQARIQRSAFFLLLAAVQPAIFLVVTMLAAQPEVRPPFAHVAVGVALVALWGSTVWQAGLILRQESWFGTLPGIVSRPVGLATVLIGKTLGATLQAAGCIVLTVAAISLASRRAIEIERPVAFALAALSLIASAITLGFLLSCLFLLTRSALRIAEALIYPGFILGGLLVPVALLPGWAQPLANGVSLYWGARLVRDAVDGNAQSAQEWLFLALTTGVYAVLASVLFGRVLSRARRVGSLELV